MTNRCLRPIAGPVGSIARSQPSWSAITSRAGLASTHWLFSEGEV
jgi:hypothetical protein